MATLKMCRSFEPINNAERGGGLLVVIRTAPADAGTRETDNRLSL